jgi:hypothetical protein
VTNLGEIEGLQRSHVSKNLSGELCVHYVTDGRLATLTLPVRIFKNAGLKEPPETISILVRVEE